MNRVDNETAQPVIPAPTDHILSDRGKECLRSLMGIWFSFERDLANVPVIQRLEADRLSRSDYLLLLLNMRQQVIEGSRWISRSASSFDRNYADVRSEVIQHAYEEHRDYEMIEQDFVNAGGDINSIQSAARNIGSEALHGFMMYRASQPNPVDMIGAMWIIEGLGEKMATKWAEHIDRLYVKENSASFMTYHAAHDGDHLDKLYRLIDRVCQNDTALHDITRTARVVARLYLMQLEEVDRNENE